MSDRGLIVVSGKWVHMVKIAIFGLAIDIIGASILVTADMPTWRKELASDCPAIRDGETARRKLTTDFGGTDVTLEEGSCAYNAVVNVIKQRRQEVAEKGKLGGIRSYELETGLFKIEPQNFALERPIYSDDLSDWIAEWEAKYIRRLGLGVLILGFFIQILAAGS